MYFLPNHLRFTDSRVVIWVGCVAPDEKCTCNLNREETCGDGSMEDNTEISSKGKSVSGVGPAVFFYEKLMNLKGNLDYLRTITILVLHGFSWLDLY
jgi:hypothetical protein